MDPSTPDFVEIPQGDSALINTEITGGEPMEWDLTVTVLRKREQSDVLKRGEKLLREAFEEKLEDPNGQVDSVLPTSQEILPRKET